MLHQLQNAILNAGSCIGEGALLAQKLHQVKKSALSAGLCMYEGALLAAAVSSDGRYLAVGGGDRKVHVWDARSRQYIQVQECMDV